MECCYPLQCEHTTTLEAFFQQVLSGPTKTAILGSGCSDDTELADISHFYNIIQARSVADGNQ